MSPSKHEEKHKKYQPLVSRFRYGMEIVSHSTERLWIEMTDYRLGFAALCSVFCWAHLQSHLRIDTDSETRTKPG